MSGCAQPPRMLLQVPRVMGHSLPLASPALSSKCQQRLSSSVTIFAFPNVLTGWYSPNGELLGSPFGAEETTYTPVSLFPDVETQRDMKPVARVVHCINAPTPSEGGGRAWKQEP